MDTQRWCEMLTKDQALTSQEFHAEGCTRHVGTRGGVTEHIEVWRRNGKTQVWKTRPDEFRVPIKHGLHAYGAITEVSARWYHVAKDCPLLRTEGEEE